MGKPLTFEELLDAGMARVGIVHCIQVAEVSPALGFDAMVKALREAKDRAELPQQGVIVHRGVFPAPH